jgi:prephenate dehydrogenase
MSEPQGARFGIIGLGQIGGSLAKALKLRGLAELVSGFDIDAKLQHEALQRGVIDHAAKSTAELIGLSEIVIIAVPIAGIEETLDRHAEILSEKLLVTDTGSLKQAIVQLADEKNLANFVGGHPLAGTEKRATAAWDGNLFAGANYFYAATPNGNTTATELLQQLLRSIDAEPID